MIKSIVSRLLKDVFESMSSRVVCDANNKQFLFEMKAYLSMRQLLCLTVYSGDILFCWRSVFVQATTEC